MFEGLSFDLRSGDALQVSGANGAGKSSLLRLAAGLLAAASGRVVRDGRLALADERPALDLSRPLIEALDYWAAIDGGDARPAVEALGLSALADVPVRMLSTGQRRRATLARTIAARAPIWLLDEPANGLDAVARAALWQSIAAHRAIGGILVVASHLPLEIPDLRDLAL